MTATRRIYAVSGEVLQRVKTACSGIDRFPPMPFENAPALGRA
jgi:hypothetical protein